MSEKAKEAAKKEKVVEPTNDDDLEDDDDDEEKMLERRRMKSYEELTDPAAIVHSYDRGLFKPRVGWQFRYRVSRYIDSLRENIREDQQRLKLGLEAIKRKTPQELSGRRKRVLDKPFEPEPEAPVEVKTSSSLLADLVRVFRKTNQMWVGVIVIELVRCSKRNDAVIMSTMKKRNEKYVWDRRAK